jgi:hypothetical protein
MIIESVVEEIGFMGLYIQKKMLGEYHHPVQEFEFDGVEFEQYFTISRSSSVRQITEYVWLGDK